MGWTAASQPHKVDDQPLATLPFWDFPFSQSDDSIFEKIPFSHHQAIHGNVGTSFRWLDVLPDQSARIMEEMLDLATSSVAVKFYFPTVPYFGITEKFSKLFLFGSLFDNTQFLILYLFIKIIIIHCW